MKIAVICAYAQAYNTGMLSVDLSALSVMRRTFGKGVKVDFFTVEDDHDAGRVGSIHLKYSKLSNVSQLSGYDRILLWGDFLANGFYHRRDLMSRFKSREGDGFKPSLRKAVNLLLMRDLPDSMLKRTICFGGSLFGNALEDELDNTYIESIRRLYSGSRLVLTRDPMSAFYAQRYSGWCLNDPLGVDAAWLLQPFDDIAWNESREKSQNSLRIGLSFGRGLTKNDDSLGVLNRFSETLLKNLPGCVEDIGWLKANRSNPLAGLLKKLGTVGEMDLIITDTYHCAINAWREGTPALCIGRGADMTYGTLSEKKKELVYTSVNARDYYLFYENIRENPVQYAEKILSAIPGFIQGSGRVRDSFLKASIASGNRLADALI